LHRSSFSARLCRLVGSFSHLRSLAQFFSSHPYLRFISFNFVWWKLVLIHRNGKGFFNPLSDSAWSTLSLRLFFFLHLFSSFPDSCVKMGCLWFRRRYILFYLDCKMNFGQQVKGKMAGRFGLT
jgi:hypothetical protein